MQIVHRQEVWILASLGAGGKGNYADNIFRPLSTDATTSFADSSLAHFVSTIPFCTKLE